MVALVFALGVLLYLVMLLAGLGGRINQSASAAARQIPGLVPLVRPCYTWITKELVSFSLRLLLWMSYMGTVMAVLCLVYWTISSEGLRRAFADLGIKLWQIPFLTGLRNYQESKDLDLAHVIAVMLMLCSLYILHEVAKLQLGMVTSLRRHAKNSEVYERLVRTIAVVMLGIDLALFYLSVTQASWGGTFDVKAFFVSVGYVCMLVILTLGSILLEPFGKRRIEHENSYGNPNGIADPTQQRVHAHN